MMCRLLAVAMLVGACGNVSDKPADAAVGAVTWRNQPGDVPAVTFGGVPYCMYTITLKQLDVQLAILPSGQVTSGQVQDLNMEAVIPSTAPVVCTANNPPPIPANIAMYQLATAAPSAGGATLTFQGGTTNSPPATLVVELTKVNSLYTATLTFQRNDGLDAVLEWKVTTTLPLAPP